MLIFIQDVRMRITVELDDELLADAATLTDIREPSALLHEALKALVERERSAAPNPL